jgi:hypothetical protein
MKAEKKLNGGKLSRYYIAYGNINMKTPKNLPEKMEIS